MTIRGDMPGDTAGTGGSGGTRKLAMLGHAAILLLVMADYFLLRDLGPICFLIWHGATFAPPSTLLISIFGHMALTWLALELSVGTRSLLIPLAFGACLGFAVVPIGTIPTILHELEQPTVTIGPIAVGIAFYVLICLSLSMVFAFVMGTWFVVLVRAISQARRTKAADGSELVLLALVLGWLSLATVMACLTHWVGWPSVSELTDPFQLRRDVWLGALPLCGMLAVWIFVRRAWRAAWLGRVRRGKVRDHVLEPIAAFPNADEIPPFHSTAAPYTSVLVRRNAETSTVLGRTA